MASSDQLIFICHSSQDEVWALDLATHLEAAGMPCWIGPRDVPAGADYARVIDGAIEGATGFVVLYSQHSSQSWDCLNELELACRRRVRLYSVQLDETPLSEDYRYRLARTQWAKGSPAEVAARLVAAASSTDFGRDERTGFAKVSGIADLFVEVIEEMAEITSAPTEDGHSDFVVSTGFPHLDDILDGGLHSNRVTLVAAAAGVGASGLALTIARQATVDRGIATLIVAPGAGDGEILMRITAATALISIARLRDGTMDDRDWDQLSRSLPSMMAAPLSITSDPTVTVEELLVELENMPAPRLLLIDPTLSSDEAVRWRLGSSGPFKYARAIRRLAAATDTAVVLVTRLEISAPGAPAAGGAPWPDALGQNRPLADLAHNVLVLEREEDSVDPGPRRDRCDVVVKKSETGWLGPVPLVFQGHFARFVADDAGH